MMSPNCVVFDMEGVLFDSESLVLSCWERVADTHAIARIRQTCQRCLGINAVTTKQIFCQEYGADFPYDTYKAEMSALYWEAVENGALVLKPGVR
ncbi:MAG: hypothetical protein LUC50_05730 [Ruminococcus sp.]|nr:hypothetical protein [Ruminococcus sp.]